MGTRIIITFEQDMDDVTAGAFGLWLDSVLKAEAEDDPESDHGPFTVTVDPGMPQFSGVRCGGGGGGGKGMTITVGPGSSGGGAGSYTASPIDL